MLLLETQDFLFGPILFLSYPAELMTKLSINTSEVATVVTDTISYT
jgi:hypothetical protein